MQLQPEYRMAAVKVEQIHLHEPPAQGRAPGRVSERALVVALVLSALFWLLAWYSDTARAMVSIWLRSETFAHGFLIAPISAWLIWQRRRVLAAVEIRPGLLAFPALALAGFGWLLGELAGVGVAQQFCLVIMIALMVWAIAGNQVIAAIAFPVFFLLFAVPFGEFLEPPLMEHTANFTVAALRATGIPVYREGLFFTLPTGSWSIVEACSGLRYLIASLTVGFLYAYLTYRSLARRAAFVGASIVVPVVANWLRAYMVVMIGHLSGMKYAVGVDHLIYGWIFFGIVMLLLFWIGSFWREDLDAAPDAPVSVSSAPGDRLSLVAVAGAAVAAAAMAAVWPVTAERLRESGSFERAALQAPQPAGGWDAVPARGAGLTPRFLNTRAAISQAYVKGTRSAGIFIGYYRNQRPGAQLVSSQNQLVSSEDREWKKVAGGGRTVAVGNEEIPVDAATLRGASTDLLVWRWYWVDGHYVVNPYWAKLLQAKAMLSGRGDDGAVIVVVAPYLREPDAAERTLREFTSVMLPAINTSLENARRSRSAS